MAKLYKTNGGIITVTPKDKKNGFSLEECYNLIDCSTITAHRLSTQGKGLWFVADDEALLKERPEFNIKATAKAREISKLNYNLFGNVLFCDDKEFQ